MVSFQCDGCSDVIKKPKLDQHRSRCRTSFTCLDCSKTFPTPADYKGHTSCVSEAEKYEKSVYQGPRQANGRGRGGFQQYGSRNQHQNRFGRGGNQYQRSSYQPSGANGTPLGGSPKMTWSPSPPAAQFAKENDKTSEKRKHTQENSEVREEVQPSKKIKFEDGSSHPVGLVTITDIIGDEIVAEDKEKREKKKDRKDKKDKKRKGEDVEIRTNIQPEGKQWTPSELPPPQSSENASETAAEPDLSETSSTKKSKRKDETAEDKKARKEEKRRRKLAAKAEVQEDNGPTADELSSKKSKKSKTPKDTEQQDVITPHDKQHGDGETESRSDEMLEKKRKKERSGEKRKDKESRKKAEEVTV